VYSSQPPPDPQQRTDYRDAKAHHHRGCAGIFKPRTSVFAAIDWVTKHYKHYERHNNHEQPAKKYHVFSLFK